MLYDDTLEYWQNSNRWRERHKQAFEAGTLTNWHQLSSSDIQRLQSLNRTLTQIQRQLWSQTHALYVALSFMLKLLDENKTKQPDATFTLHLFYTMREDDPEYQANLEGLKENCVYWQQQTLSPHELNAETPSPASAFGLLDCCDFIHPKPEGHEPHCWLFYDLHNNHDLLWEDVLRIGRIRTRIEISDMSRLDLDMRLEGLNPSTSL